MGSELALRIRKATINGLSARDRYSDRTTILLTQGLKRSQEEIAKAILKYKTLGSLPDNKLAALTGLEKLQIEIADVLKRLKQDQTLLFRRSTKESFKLGIGQGIGDLANASMPFYKDLGKNGIDKLAAKVFTIVDTNALDFMSQYNLTLAGDIHRELSDGIKRTILGGIATGKSADDIVRDMGKVILDKKSFRQAGTKVFSKAQYRMEMIARTEVLRAHNMGRLKFHERVGIQKLEWLATDDERMCPVCGSLDGKEFAIDKFPQQPAHPNCRCTNTITWPVAICGTDLRAKAAPSDPQGDACILPPHVLEGMADAQAHENAKLKETFEKGETSDLNALTVKQLQTLAKQNGVSVARTKADFIKLLDATEPGIDHGDLAGAALSAKLKQYNIGLLRSKDELVSLLAQKQSAFKSVKLQAAQSPQNPPTSNLHDLSVKQLQELAKQNDISLNMTKQEVIELLDELEPGIDHSQLEGQALAAMKAKHGIPTLKNKEQLVSILKKKAEFDLAEAAKKKAIEEAASLAAAKKKEAISAAMNKVVVPGTLTDYTSFHASIHEAIQELSSSGVTWEMKTAGFKEIDLKKQVFKDQVGKLKLNELKKLAKDTQVKHWQWANKDELIVLFTDPNSIQAQNALKSIEEKHTTWATKYGSGYKPKQSANPSPSSMPPSEQTPIGKPVNKISQFDEIDKEWAAKGHPSNFKFLGKANVGGAHEKEFWTDANGDKWLFKPSQSADEFVAHGEEAAYKIARLIDKKQIEVRTIKLNGRMGTIQMWRKDLAPEFDFRNIDPQNLTTSEMEQIQREHVVDWLISNHDGHSKQFLRTKDGTVYGIDKGQAFKFLGSDDLSIAYHPNGKCGEEEPYYNKVFRAAKQGKVQFDPKVTLRYITEVERISDEEYSRLLAPYADGRFGKDELSRKQFLEQALDRKHNLRKDFESYYGDILGQRGFRFDSVALELKKGKIGAAEKAIIDEARALGWQGKALPFDGDQVEDQNALIFSETIGEKQRTVIKMKIRPEAEKQILKAIRLGQDPKDEPPKPIDEDHYFGDILKTIKHISHHAEDGQYEEPKIAIALQHRNDLKKLAGSSKDKDLQAMAQNYLKWLDEIDQARNGRRKVSGEFSQYLKLPESRTPNDKAIAYRTKEESVKSTLRRIKQGQIKVEEDEASNSKLFGGRSIAAGKQYTVLFEDGTKIRYRPWSADNMYAQRGELEVIHEGDLSGEHIETILGKLDLLGVDTSIASIDNAEYMYLQKLAYIRKTDESDDYKQMMRQLNKREANLNERVSSLRDYWQKELKISDITKMPGYDPRGEYQAGFLNDKIAGGYRHQYRFDITDEDLEKQMKGYSLYHDLTNREEIIGFMDRVLDNNGAMVSTIEKMRIGIQPGGMSPEQDMRTGGASYFFTRVKKIPESNPPEGLYFKKKLLRRMDAVSYSHDAYGKVIDDYVRDNRGSTIGDWKGFAQNSSNETIFKYSVTLLDNIDYIIVSDDKERQKVLDSFSRKGIKRLPDGRAIEKVVQTRNGWKSDGK